MDDAAGSFKVHLQSLRDFTLRLQEQLEVIQQPTRRVVEVLSQAPSLPLGSFAEAHSLSDDHSDVGRQMAVLLETVGRSLDFSRSVTALVAQRYEALDAGGAQKIASLGGSMPAPPVPVSSVTGIAAPPAGSLAAPEILARITVPVPPEGGTVYYYNGSTAVPVSGAVPAQDA